MRFRLPKFAAIAIFLLPGLLEARDLATVLSDKGGVFTLRSTGVRTLDLRSDGRYMFFSAGGSSFTVLDLLDMGRMSAPVTTVGSVLGIFVDSNSKLIVSTTTAVQSFDISKPLRPAEFADLRWTRPTDSSLTPIDSCYAGSSNVIFLERHSDGIHHRIRLVKGQTTSLSSETNWSVFTNVANGGTSVSPYALRCSGANIFIFGSKGTFGSQNDIFVSATTAAAPLSFPTAKRFYKDERHLKDFVITQKKDELALLFNRTTTLNQTDDSQVLSVGLPGLSEAATINVGKGATALATYQETGNIFGNAVYVATDLLAGTGTNKLLVKNLPFGTGVFDTDRGAGSSSVGGTSQASRWFSTNSDNYKYGITNSTGLALLGRGPKITVITPPPTGKISSSTPLTMTFSADRAITYEIRYDPDWSLDGDASGLRFDTGNLIRTRELPSGVSESISISTTELGIKKEGKSQDAAYLVAWDPQATSAKSRVGIQFQYNPPPSAVRNFHLEFGDQSIHVCFDSPLSDDIAGYIIRYSYSSSDIATVHTVEGANGTTLRSPINVAANEVKGCYVIHPVKNGVPLFVQLYAYDTENQEGPVTPVLSRAAFRTMTLAEALGGTSSCSLSLRNESLSVWSAIVFGLFLLTFGWLRRSRQTN